MAPCFRGHKQGWAISNAKGHKHKAMSGESPLNMMRSAPRPVRKRAAAPRRRRLWPYLAPVAIIIVVAVGWSWLWYYAASIADRALSGWIDREAALGRVYACGTQSIGGFPFSIVTRCDQ